MRDWVLALAVDSDRELPDDAQDCGTSRHVAEIQPQEPVREKKWTQRQRGPTVNPSA